MPKPKPKAAPKPTIKMHYEYAHEDFEVEIPIPYWAKHKGPEGGEPSDKFEEEGGESMWELHVDEWGKKLAKKAFEAKAAKLKAEEAAKNNKRIASLKASFDVFDKDGSGKLGSDEVLEILTRMTGGEEPLTEEDAIEFIKEFDRDGDGEISVDEFILAMGVVSDAVDHDGDGKADKGESKYDGEEEKFAEDLVKGDIGGKVHIKAGAVSEGVEDARRMQKA